MHRKGVQFGGKAHLNEFSGQPFIERSQSTPKGPGGSDNNYFLQMPGLRLISNYKGIESEGKPAKLEQRQGRGCKKGLQLPTSQFFPQSDNDCARGHCEPPIRPQNRLKIAAYL